MHLDILQDGFGESWTIRDPSSRHHHGQKRTCINRDEEAASRKRELMHSPIHKRVDGDEFLGRDGERQSFRQHFGGTEDDHGAGAGSPLSRERWHKQLRVALPEVFTGKVPVLIAKVTPHTGGFLLAGDTLDLNTFHESLHAICPNEEEDPANPDNLILQLAWHLPVAFSA